jgi:Right handed beta helix region
MLTTDIIQKSKFRRLLASEFLCLELQAKGLSMSMKYWVFLFMITLCSFFSAELTTAEEVNVSNSDQLRRILADARPGLTILLAKGEYQAGLYADDLHGTEEKPITIRAADPANRPVIRNGKTGIHISRASHLILDGLEIDQISGNGINLDDGGEKGGKSHHITLRNIDVRNAGTMGGNLDGIKISGVDQFSVERCRVVGWGNTGSAIDMVGCHQGEILDCFFQAGVSNQGTGVQAKGGSADIAIRGCRFEEAGSRAVNIGGSTGLPYFRPENANYEAKRITVEDSLFIGSHSPIVFVGIDGAKVSHNTIINPGKYVVRILQETRGERFVACRGGVFERNLVVYDPVKVASSTNVGQGTDPGSFQFRGNAWVSRTGRGRIRHEIASEDDLRLESVVFEDEAVGDFRPKQRSSPPKVGARQMTVLQGIR